MKTIDVAMVSWPNHPRRIEYVETILEALTEKLSASGHILRYFMSAEMQLDPDHTWHGDELEKLCEHYGIVLQWRGPPANLGANMNAAMRMGTGDFIYLQQDDWLLREPLDLSPGADLLDKYYQLDIVRYSWPDSDAMRPTFNGDIEGWRTIDPKGKWPYGDDPHLRRRDFMERWCWYKEGDIHGSASGSVMEVMADGGALSVVADKVYYEHHGRVSAVLGDHRSGANRRYEDE